MADKKTYSKTELIAMAKKQGFFKKPAVDNVWARENGHFYYVTPPNYTDGLASYKITRKDVEGKKPTTKKETKKN